MRTDTIDRLNAEFTEFPIMRADGVPNTAEIMDASRQLGIPFAGDYQEFLLRYGGGMVGPYPIFGLRPVEVMGKGEWSVVDVTREFRAQRVPGSDRWVIISLDHAGNPMGVDK